MLTNQQPLRADLHPNKLPTPINVKKLDDYLKGYDGVKRQYLVDGFTKGFCLEYEGNRGFQDSPNLKSALEKPDIVLQKIKKEINAGRVVGPFDSLPFENLKISPLGLVGKKKPNEYRLIHHLSYPDKKVGSVNAGISDSSAFVQYANISDAITAIKQLGLQSHLCKTDIRSAFRILCVSPQDYELLGFKWENKYYFDRCLPVGCRTSCKIFEEFSSALEWIAVNKLGISGMVHVLDDFLIIEASKQEAVVKFKKFLQMCEEIGVPLSNEKTVLPTQIIDFVGITLDVQKSEARLPVDKISKCKNLLFTFLQKDRCTLKDMQSLIGLLNFACLVVQPGRAFLRRMINLTMGIPESQKCLFLHRDIKADRGCGLIFCLNTMAYPFS